MSTPLEAPVQAERRPLSLASTVARLALIGLALAVVAGAFAYLGGWLTPNNLTPARFTDAFQHVDGVHAGFRRTMPKAWACPVFSTATEWSAFLEGDCLPPRRVPVVGRFSLSGGQPNVATAPMRCAASGSNSIAGRPKCGEPR